MSETTPLPIPCQHSRIARQVPGGTSYLSSSDIMRCALCFGAATLPYKCVQNITRLVRIITLTEHRLDFIKIVSQNHIASLMEMREMSRQEMLLIARTNRYHFEYKIIPLSKVEREGDWKREMARDIALSN